MKSESSAFSWTFCVQEKIVWIFLIVILCVILKKTVQRLRAESRVDVHAKRSVSSDSIIKQRRDGETLCLSLQTLLCPSKVHLCSPQSKDYRHHFSHAQTIRAVWIIHVLEHMSLWVSILKGSRKQTTELFEQSSFSFLFISFCFISLFTQKIPYITYERMWGHVKECVNPQGFKKRHSSNIKF